MYLAFSISSLEKKRQGKKINMCLTIDGFPEDSPEQGHLPSSHQAKHKTAPWAANPRAEILQWAWLGRPPEDADNPSVTSILYDQGTGLTPMSRCVFTGLQPNGFNINERMKTEPGRNTEHRPEAVRCTARLGLKGALNRRGITPFTSGEAWAVLGKEIQVSQQKKVPGNSIEGLLDAGCNLSTEERGTPDMWSTTNPAGARTQIPESKPSLETWRFEQEIATTTWKWVMIALGGAWAVVGLREYSFSHHMESKERTEGVEKSKGKLPVSRRRLPVGLTVWKRAVSSLLMSSTRIVDLLWVTFPISFHLVKR